MSIKRSHMFQQTCNWKLWVYSSMHNLLVETRCWRANIEERSTLFQTYIWHIHIAFDRKFSYVFFLVFDIGKVVEKRFWIVETPQQSSVTKFCKT